MRSPIPGTAPSRYLAPQLDQLVPPAAAPTVEAVRRQLADGTGIAVLTLGSVDANDKTPADALAARVRLAVALAAVALLVALGLVAWLPTSIAALAVALAVALAGGACLWLASFRLLQHIRATEAQR